MDHTLPTLADLQAMRVLLLRKLADSMEVSQFALARNDGEMVARGAAHQAELCRQWSQLEEQLRSKADQRRGQSVETELCSSEGRRQSQRLESEFAALTSRIRHLARVHWSLLRHLQRSLTILGRAVESCAPTY